MSPEWCPAAPADRPYTAPLPVEPPRRIFPEAFPPANWHEPRDVAARGLVNWHEPAASAPTCPGPRPTVPPGGSLLPQRSAPVAPSPSGRSPGAPAPLHPVAPTGTDPPTKSPKARPFVNWHLDWAAADHLRPLKLPRLSEATKRSSRPAQVRPLHQLARTPAGDVAARDKPVWSTGTVLSPSGSRPGPSGRPCSGRRPLPGSAPPSRRRAGAVGARSPPLTVCPRSDRSSHTSTKSQRRANWHPVVHVWSWASDGRSHTPCPSPTPPSTGVSLRTLALTKAPKVLVRRAPDPRDPGRPPDTGLRPLQLPGAAGRVNGGVLHKSSHGRADAQ